MNGYDDLLSAEAEDALYPTLSDSDADMQSLFLSVPLECEDLKGGDFD